MLLKKLLYITILIFSYTINGQDSEECGHDAPEVRINIVRENSVGIQWSFMNLPPFVDNYEINYREVGSNIWNQRIINRDNIEFGAFLSVFTGANLGTLLPNTEYEWRVRLGCPNGAYGPWSETLSFTTLTGCEFDIIVSDDVNTGQSDIQSAESTITAINVINGGGTANYDAGGTVRLQPGFYARRGANFRAFIEGCFIIGARSVEEEVSVKEEIIETEYFNILTTVYPNPTNNFFTIESNQMITGYSLFNSFGKEVLNKEELGNKTTVNIENLPQGIYILRIVLQSGEVVMKKIIKN